MSADGKETTPSVQGLRKWLKKNLTDYIKDDVVQISPRGCYGRGKHYKYMFWGGLEIGETTLRLNLFYVGENDAGKSGIFKSAQLVVLEENAPGGSIKRPEHDQNFCHFEYAAGSHSAPINNVKDLREQIGIFLEKGKFPTKGIIVVPSECKKHFNDLSDCDQYTVVDLSNDDNLYDVDWTTKNIHPQPKVINRVFKKLVKKGVDG